MAAHETTKAGELRWSELMAIDHDAAVTFYGEVFGWKKLDAMDMGPMGKYVIFGLGDTQMGGIMNKPAEMPVRAWGYGIHVADLDASIARAQAGGAKLLNGPMDVPGGARVANLMDPQGAMFSLHGASSRACSPDRHPRVRHFRGHAPPLVSRGRRRHAASPIVSLVPAAP